MSGAWSLSYDNVNRVSTAVATSGVWNNLTLSWSYDSFCNRKTQTPSGQNVMAPVPQAQTLSYSSQNRISNYGAVGYDAVGNVLYDQINRYLYYPEGRLCAAARPRSICCTSTTEKGGAWPRYPTDVQPYTGKHRLHVKCES